MGIQRVRPSFVATNVITGEERTDRVVLEANLDHNTSRTARLERVVFVNDLTPAEALDAVCDEDGVLDIVTEIAAGDAARVESSEHARLVRIEANRMLVGIFNTWPDTGAPLGDRRVREAITLAVDRDRIVAEAFLGHADPLVSLTPPRLAAAYTDAAPRACDPARARELLTEVGWPEGRPLVLATPGGFAAIGAMVAEDLRAALGIEVDLVEVPDEAVVGGSLMLIEKKLTPPWDVLLHAWFDLSSDLPPAVVHREFFGDDGAFRAGPPDPAFDERFQRMARSTDADTARAAATDVDRYCFEEAKALFLCAPHALYAVNRHVDFVAYKTTLELAETEVSPEHWSRRVNGA